MVLESLIKVAREDDRGSSLILEGKQIVNGPGNFVDAIQALVSAGFLRVITGFPGSDVLRFDNEILLRALSRIQMSSILLEDLDVFTADLEDGTSVCEWVGLLVESDPDGVVSRFTPVLLGRDNRGMWTFADKGSGVGILFAIYKARP